MQTYMANPDKIERKWYVVDAEGCTLGRLASGVASVLRGRTPGNSGMVIKDAATYPAVVTFSNVRLIQLANFTVTLLPAGTWAPRPPVRYLLPLSVLTPHTSSEAGLT